MYSATCVYEWQMNAWKIEWFCITFFCESSLSCTELATFLRDRRHTKLKKKRKPFSPFLFLPFNVYTKCFTMPYNICSLQFYKYINSWNKPESILFKRKWNRLCLFCSFLLGMWRHFFILFVMLVSRRENNLKFVASFPWQYPTQRNDLNWIR